MLAKRLFYFLLLDYSFPQDSHVMLYSEKMNYFKLIKFSHIALPMNDRDSREPAFVHIGFLMIASQAVPYAVV